jgi:hypothetical protein
MAAPIRGTQSFVAIMGQVWDRPSLTAVEIAWRWVTVILAALLCSAAAFWNHGSLSHSAADVLNNGFDMDALKSMTVFQPLAAAHTISRAIHVILVSTAPLLIWLFPLLLLLWSVIAAFGRTLVLRRLDPALHARRFSIFLLGALRALLLAVAWVLWFLGLTWAARAAIIVPAQRGEEPSLVLFAAMLICGTLALYVVWAVFSWFLQLAPLLAMQCNLGPLAALRAALTSNKELRGKLIEINLVMNIVRIALIVLAMVFSASPLPFSSVETQTFLTCWWIGTGLLYLAMSDYFHVVRAAAYLSLYRAYARD